MDRGPSVVVTHPGSQQSYETVAGLQDARMLHRFVASVYGSGDAAARVPYRVLPRGLRDVARQGLQRRRHPSVDDRLVTQLLIPFLAMRAAGIALDRAHLSRLSGVERLGDAWFDKSAARWLRRREGVTQVHAFEGAALFTLREARRRDFPAVLDAPSAHEYNLSLAAAEAVEYGVRLPLRFGSRTRVARERELADAVVSPSDFVTSCLVEHGVPGKKIVAIPFGADVDQFSPAERMPSGHFRLLSVASINYRKGTRYLLQAWRELALPDAELVLAGTPDDAGRAILREYEGSYRALGHLPWYELPNLFRSASAFVLPSLAEGSALVTYMAMASGLPVIVTADAGSVARDGADGIVVPSRSVDALKAAITRLYERRADAAAMGMSGRRLITSKYTWRHYHRRISALHGALHAGVDPARAVAEIDHPDVGRERTA